MQPAPHSINGYWINLILVLLLNTSRLFQLVRFLLHQEAAKFRKLLHPGLFLLLLGPRAFGAPWLVSHSSVSMALVRHLWKALVDHLALPSCLLPLLRVALRWTHT